MTAAHSPSSQEPGLPEPLWEPSPEHIASARLTRFQAWAAEHHGAPAAVPGDPRASYEALHRWSVDELAGFWQAVAEWFDIRFSTPYDTVLADDAMPGATWFPGAALNYAEHALRAGEDPARADDPALLHVDEEHQPLPVTWSELRRQVGSLAAELRRLGVRPGDRVFWFTTTGWMMWNFLVSCLLTDAAIVLYDGNPGHPDMSSLWQLAADAEVRADHSRAPSGGSVPSRGMWTTARRVGSSRRSSATVSRRSCSLPP